MGNARGDDAVPDPASEPEGGAAAGGAPRDDDAVEGAVDKADNAERVLDPDREGDDPEEDARATVDRMERHDRGRPGVDDQD